MNERHVHREEDGLRDCRRVLLARAGIPNNDRATAVMAA